MEPRLYVMYVWGHFGMYYGFKCFSVCRMEAKPAGDMPSTTASSEKGDEGFSVPSSIRAVSETAPKVEVRILTM